jgi:kanamycin nucleotidyltransferase
MMSIWSGPQAQTHDDRLSVLDRIVADLQRTYGNDLIAVGLYGSMGRGTDGPHSDIELFCVVDRLDLDFSYEWVYGPGKAEVNIYSAEAMAAAAQEVEERWPLEAGAFANCRPLLGDPAYFAELKALALSPAKEKCDEMVRAMVVGELYEWMGKLRNGLARGETSFVPTLACDFVTYVALIAALVHRRLYSTGSTLLAESLALPDLPDGYDAACRLVMAGELSDAARNAAALEALWVGLGPWLTHHGIDMEPNARWPWRES